MTKWVVFDDVQKQPLFELCLARRTTSSIVESSPRAVAEIRTALGAYIRQLELLLTLQEQSIVFVRQLCCNLRGNDEDDKGHDSRA